MAATDRLEADLAYWAEVEGEEIPVSGSMTLGNHLENDIVIAGEDVRAVSSSSCDGRVKKTGHAAGAAGYKKCSGMRRQGDDQLVFFLRKRLCNSNPLEPCVQILGDSPEGVEIVKHHGEVIHNIPKTPSFASETGILCGKRVGFSVVFRWICRHCLLGAVFVP